MKRNKKDRYSAAIAMAFAFVFLALGSVKAAAAAAVEKSPNEQPSKAQDDAGTGARQGRQLPQSSSGVLASHYEANRQPVATSRDAPVASYNGAASSYDPQYYRNYNSNGVASDPHPQQLQYSPSEAANAYYYYHYPEHMKSKLAYSGPHYSSDSGDYGNQKTSNLVDTSSEYKFGSYIYNFIRDVLPPREADSKTDPVTLTGLASLVVSSLSGLSWVAIAALVLVLAPILIPLVVAPLIFLLLVLYFVPVIRIDIPATGRGMGILKHLDTTAHFYKRMLQNEECLERISCEIARFSRGNMFEEWISTKLENSSSKWLHRFSRSFKAAKEGHSCQIFSCNTKYHYQKSLGATKYLD